VFTSTYDGTIYAFDTKTGKTAWTKKAPAGINSFPAIDRDTLLIGAGAPGFSKHPDFGLVAYRLGSGSGATSGGSKNATVQVQGGEYFFKLSAKSLARPGTATFVFKNVGHTVHDFSIGGKVTPLLQPGQTARLTVTFTKAGSYQYLCTVGGHAQLGMEGTFTVH